MNTDDSTNMGREIKYKNDQCCVVVPALDELLVVQVAPESETFLFRTFDQ